MLSGTYDCLSDRISKEDEGRRDGALRIATDITCDESVHLARSCSEHAVRWRQFHPNGRCQTTY